MSALPPEGKQCIVCHTAKATTWGFKMLSPRHKKPAKVPLCSACRARQHGAGFNIKREG